VCRLWQRLPHALKISPTEAIGGSGSCGGAGDVSSDCAAGGAEGVGIDGGGVMCDGALRPRDNLAKWQ
jgi:hypothetical protein